MDVPPPFAELPDEVCFALDEVADVLFTVDVAVEKTARGTAEREVARRSQRLITSRLGLDWDACVRSVSEQRVRRLRR